MAFGEEQNRFLEEQAREEMDAHTRVHTEQLGSVALSLSRIASSVEVLVIPVKVVVMAGEGIYRTGQALRREVKSGLDYLLKRGDIDL